MATPGIAVKAYIVGPKGLLILKRTPKDSHYADKWDIPGGRLTAGEDPIVGLRRETFEEAGIDIDVLLPLDVQHFTRDDGQVITMIIFLCKPKSEKVKLSKEHTNYKWVLLGERKEHPEWLGKTTDLLFKYGLDKSVS